MANYLPVSVGGLMIAGGAAIVVQGFRNVAAARMSESWPTAPGESLSSEVVRLGTSKNNCTCSIRFRYKVDGEEFESSKVSLFGIWTRKESEQFVEQFPAGKQCDVYYPPDDPQRAVLVPGVYGKNKTHAVCMGLLLALFGLGVMLPNL